MRRLTPTGFARDAVAGLREVHDLTRIAAHEERVLALVMADLAAVARTLDQ